MLSPGKHHGKVNFVVVRRCDLWIPPGQPDAWELATMLNSPNANPNEAATFRGLISTITGLSQAAELRGDRASATILINIAALLAEVQVSHPLDSYRPDADPLYAAT